jgi:hypothetical protein
MRIAMPIGRPGAEGQTEAGQQGQGGTIDAWVLGLGHGCSPLESPGISTDCPVDLSALPSKVLPSGSKVAFRAPWQ